MSFYKGVFNQSWLVVRRVLILVICLGIIIFIEFDNCCLVEVNLIKVFVFVIKKVKLNDFINDQFRDLISGEDGLLKEVLKKGDF